MDVTLENPVKDGPGGLARALRVRIPSDRVSTALSERLKNIASRAKVAGFRPGKAPLAVVERQYGDAARLEVIQDLVRGSYPEAIDKAGVHPASAPSFEVTAEKPGEPLEYVAHFEVYPEIKLKGLDGLKVEKPVATVGDAEIDKMIENMRRGRRTLEPVSRAAKKDDVCTLDFEGFVDGVAFEGGKAQGATLEIGKGQFLPDMENGMIGRKAGEEFEIPVSFPADYRAENLKGKTATFKIRLQQLQEPKLPAVDEEFLKAHGVETGGEAALREKIRKALESERDKAVKNRVKTQVLEQLAAANEIEVPSAMVAQETGRLREEMANRFNVGKASAEQKVKMLPDELLAPNARKRVVLGLLIGEVIKHNKIVMDPKRLDALLDEMAGEYAQADLVKQHYRSRPELMQGLRAMVLEEQVVESLLAGAKTTEKTVTLDELLSQRQSAE